VDEPFTSDPTPQTRKCCQDPRRTGVKSQASVSAMNISTSNTLLAFVSGTTVARGEASQNAICHPMAQPHGTFPPDGLQSHCWAALAVVQPTVSDLNIFVTSNGPAVTGNCILPLTGLHECSFVVCC